MPKIGQAMTEGIVLEWHKQDGDHVTAGDILLTVETDKATYELEAQASGALHIYVGEGREVKVGTVIGMIGDEQSLTTAAPTAPAPSSTAAVTAQTKPPVRGKRVLASPKAKQLAAEHGFDLATLTPSSADGVISAGDVERALAEKKTTAPATLLEPPHADGRIREQRVLTGIRKATARRMQEAWQTIPHIVQMVEVDATAVRALRASLRTDIPSLTMNDLLLHAAAQVLAGLPDLNGAVAGDVLTLYGSVDVGFAVDTPRGLLVPVIRRAETLTIAQLAAESVRLIEAARAGRLMPNDMGGASLTVSNLGMFGVQFGTPVINLGESILVFVGAVEDRPVVVAGQVVVRPMLTLSIAYDHRLADGVAASQFTRGLKERLEGLGSSTQDSALRTQHLIPSTEATLARRELRSRSEGAGYTVQVRSSGHTWELDEPASDGGADRGPDPVSAFLGALLSCMTISFKAAAKRRKVDVRRVDGRVQATPQGHVKDITMTLEVWSPAPEENVRALLDVAKRGCYVSGVLKPEINFSLELVVHGAEKEE
jgi:pyruvate/2-oxoglutarate dehydrogenase complex dihydrolipoamide acyltransferase (E2) component/uncharacterized OsmC-like protein